MILTCPECSTRYQANEANFPPAGRDVRCAKCGHVWHQNPPEPEFEPEPAKIETPPQPAPPPQAFVREPVVEAEPVEEVAPKSQSPWPRRLVLGLGWAGLAVLVLAIGWAAAAYRQQVVAALPQSASLYSKLGLETNASGLQFAAVQYHQELQGGQPVLAVTGKLVNVSTHEVPVPQIRVTLSDNDKRELYHWNFVTDVMTLRPGQATRFVTRLSSPPAAARHLDLRFAKAGE
jgi:predicted Zn finger-like uncharacterized protein